MFDQLLLGAVMLTYVENIVFVFYTIYLSYWIMQKVLTFVLKVAFIACIVLVLIQVIPENNSQVMQSYLEQGLIIGKRIIAQTSVNARKTEIW